MARPKSGRKKEAKSISFDREILKKLDKMGNASEFVERAVREKFKREENPEVALRQIRNEKRKLAIQITNLTDREEETMEVVEQKKKEIQKCENIMFGRTKKTP